MDLVNTLLNTGHRAILNSSLLGGSNLAAQEYLWSVIRTSLKGSKIYRDLKLEYITNYKDYVKHLHVLDDNFYNPYVEMRRKGILNVFKFRNIRLPLLEITLNPEQKCFSLPKSSIYRTKHNKFRPGILLSFTLFDNPVEQLTIDEIEIGNRYNVFIGTSGGFLKYPTDEVIEIISNDGDIVFKVV